MSLALLAILGIGCPSLAEPAPNGDDQSGEVDAATKQLIAAHGLFQRGLFSHAAQAYADFLSDHPDHPQRTAAMYALAICEYRQNEFDKAVPLLTATLRDGKFAQRDEALAVLGHCQWQLRKYDEAVAAFDELLAKHAASKHAEAAALNRAQVLYVAGKYEPASAACRQFLGQFAKSQQLDTALYVLGLSRRAAKDPSGAADALGQLVREHPQSRYGVDAMLLLGDLAESSGKLDAAIEHYRKALAAAPAERQDQVRLALGTALYEAGQNPAAIAELSPVASRQGSPFAEAAKLKLGFAQLVAGHGVEARRAFEEIARQQDAARAAEAKYGLARCEMADKRFDLARQILGELQGATPPPANAAQLSLDRAECLLESGKFAEAAGEYDAVAKRYPSTPQAWDAEYRNAFCLHRLKRYDQSHAACEALRNTKDLPANLDHPVKELDAENLVLLGKYADATAALSQLLDQEKGDDRKLALRLRIAQCAFFGGDYAKAAELLSPLAGDPRVAKEPSLQAAIFLLGDALLQQGKAAEAVQPLTTFLRVSQAQDTREARFKLALAQEKSNDAAAAERTLSELIAPGSTDDSPWVQRGLVEYAQLAKKAGRTDPAAQALRRVLAAHAPEECSAPALYLLGWIDFDAKRFTDAAAKWKQLEQDYPKHALAPDAAFERGAAMKEAGDWVNAVDVLRRFYVEHADSPHAAQAKLLEAQCLSSAGKNDAAGAVLASLAIEPKAGDAVLYELAWSQRSLKQPAEAQKTYRRLLHDHGNGKLASAARIELAELLYTDEKFAEATELLKAAIDDKTTDAKAARAASYRLAWCQLKLGRLDEAAGAFAKLADDPQTEAEPAASSALQAGLAFAQRSRWDSARKYLELFTQKYPDNAQVPLALLKLGEVHAERSDYDASARAYETFLVKYAKDPQSYRAHFGLGWAMENRKQFDAARKAYQKVIDSHNGETAARAQFQIGETFVAEGKFDKALAALLAVEDVYAYPKWASRALLESGRVLEQLKKPADARKQYELVTSKYADAPEAALAKDRLGALK
jgi:TolA-binding protein